MICDSGDLVDRALRQQRMTRLPGAQVRCQSVSVGTRNQYLFGWRRHERRGATKLVDVNQSGVLHLWKMDSLTGRAEAGGVVTEIRDGALLF